MSETFLQWQTIDLLVATSLKLSLLGTAFLITYRAGFLNLAISAQLIAGSIVGVYVASGTGSLLLSAAAAYLAMMALSTLLVVLKVYGGVDEVLSSLILLFVSLPLAQSGIRALSDSVSTPKVPFSAEWAVGDLQWTNEFHLLALPLLVFAAAMFSNWPVGYRARAMRWAQDLFAEPTQFSVLVKLHLAANACLLAVVMADTFATWAKYTPPALFLEGFDGLAVSLIAFLRFLMIPLAAFGLGIIWVFTVHMSIEFGWPESTRLLINGAVLIAAALRIGKVRA